LDDAKDKPDEKANTITNKKAATMFLTLNIINKLSTILKR
jgi:hypothetical protein